MKITQTGFEGLLIIEPRAFSDSRGYFFESYNKKAFQEFGLSMEFVQDNQSHSTRGVVRGLHYQKPPYAQSKLVRALSGTIQDVVVDIRKDKPTFGKHFSIELSAENRKQLFVPHGFAHGFIVLSDFADVIYKCDQFYRPDAESGIIFNDPGLKINWPIESGQMIFSDKDTVFPTLAKTELVF